MIYCYGYLITRTLCKIGDNKDKIQTFESFSANNCSVGVLPTPLHAAAVNGNKSLLQRLLQEGD